MGKAHKFRKIQRESIRDSTEKMRCKQQLTKNKNRQEGRVLWSPPKSLRTPAIARHPETWEVLRWLDDAFSGDASVRPFPVAEAPPRLEPREVPQWLEDAFSDGTPSQLETVWSRSSSTPTESEEPKSKRRQLQHFHPRQQKGPEDERNGTSKQREPLTSVLSEAGGIKPSCSFAPAPQKAVVKPWGPSFGLSLPPSGAGAISDHSTGREACGTKRSREDPLNPWYLTGGIPKFFQGSLPPPPWSRVPKPFLDIASKGFDGRSPYAEAAARRVKELHAVAEAGPPAFLEELRKEREASHRFTTVLEKALLSPQMERNITISDVQKFDNCQSDSFRSDY
eukprot:CAMPEP_0117778714 /NCGR_PEP_ID=MMETSP0948-20121206/1162_1 /TAXON_ID=44440 /ORGANISM="Chattonella subsalsa, Strain CCMP2191" /LENGTH=337 /DNA_ID=CAMNT_0005606101 /DNA_START=35 /DNA_END=1049 /DNA_ORIENTATION=-